MNRIDYLQAIIESQKSPMEVFMGVQDSPHANLIIDVRIGDKVFLKEKIANAQEISLLELPNAFKSLDKNKMIYVTTWNDSCTLAKQASILLIENGFKVMEIGGGNEAWKAMELPMEPIEVTNYD